MPSGKLVVWIAAISLATMLAVQHYQATKGGPGAKKYGA